MIPKLGLCKLNSKFVTVDVKFPETTVKANARVKIDVNPNIPAGYTVCGHVFKQLSWDGSWNFSILYWHDNKGILFCNNSDYDGKVKGTVSLTCVKG